ncbi:hypothetical protein J3A83DRAFT_4186522 [Scleroderma citrinum]
MASGPPPPQQPGMVHANSINTTQGCRGRKMMTTKDTCSTPNLKKSATPTVSSLKTNPLDFTRRTSNVLSKKIFSGDPTYGHMYALQLNKFATAVQSWFLILKGKYCAHLSKLKLTGARVDPTDPKHKNLMEEVYSTLLHFDKCHAISHISKANMLTRQLMMEMKLCFVVIQRKEVEEVVVDMSEYLVAMCQTHKTCG